MEKEPQSAVANEWDKQIAPLCARSLSHRSLLAEIRLHLLLASTPSYVTFSFSLQFISFGRLAVSPRLLLHWTFFFGLFLLRVAHLDFFFQFFEEHVIFWGK